MNRLLAVCLLGGALAGCSVQPITCDASHPCAIGTCDTKHDPPICSLAQGACFPLCQKYEACLSGKCTPQGPAITAVNAPTTWSRRSDTVKVTAVVDGSQGPGISGALLKISGQPDVAGTTSDTGSVRTYTFTVLGTVQAQNSESPVSFTIVATDIDNRPTLPTGVGTGQLLIDDVPPALLGGVTLVPAGTIGTGPIAWFKAGPGTIDAQVSVKDAGSGVDTTSLTLVSGGTRFDTGTPSCAQQATKDTWICHFTVSQGLVTAGSQKRFDFAVAGRDFAGNPMKVNTAALGLDARAPTISFSVGPAGTTTYPPSGANCATDTGLVACGHDGSHFWRSGDGTNYKFKFIVSDTYASPVDDTGSGPDPAGGSCVISGVPTCNVTYDPASGTFQFPAELGGATFASGADGTGTVSITVRGKDLVGNVAADLTLTTVAVTRVKWVRKEAVNLTTAPVLSTQLGLVIVGGSVTSSDSIFAARTADGSQAWKAGAAAPALGSITGSLALDTTLSSDTIHPTPILYANAGTNVFAMHFTSTGVDKYCSQAPSATPLVGSPIVFGGGSSARVIAASQDALVAFSTSLSASGGGCLQPTFYAPAPAPVFGPPSASGDTIYFGYDNHIATLNDYGIKSIKFTVGAFVTPAVGVNLNRQPTAGTVAAPISPASDLFYGVNGDHLFYRYKANLSAQVWASSPPLASTVNIFFQPLVVGSVAYGGADALYSYNATTGAAPATGWPIATNTGSQVSPPTVATNALFVADKSSPPRMGAYDLTGVSRWSYAPTGVTAIATIATEATLGPDGVLYFGDASGHIYALFSDATPLASGGSDWPRTGFDNCNSNHGGTNTGFVCQ